MVTFGDARLPERFWSKVRPVSGGCWVWLAGLNRGYGRFRFGGRVHYAHRLAYELLVGPTLRLELDHRCRCPSCVNPAHLEAVTHTENMRRGRWALATHCKHGHPFDDANTYRNPSGSRACRTCQRTWSRRARIRRRRATG